MKLTSNLRLKFAKRNNTIAITTRTYEKASFDQFLAASIAQRCKTDISAERYIDEVTGKGSMNAHLKKMYHEMDKRTREERERILDSSLYPIEKIDESQGFVFFPDFEKSLFKGKLYDGDLGQQQDLLRSIVSIDGEFVSMKIHEGQVKEHIDNYSTIIDGKEASIKVAESAFLHADSDHFTGMVVQEVIVPREIESIAADKAEGDGWLSLTNSQINGPMKSKMGFYYQNAHYLIMNLGLKKTEIGHAFGLYLYRESQISFTPDNCSICSIAAKHLLVSKEINTYKTSSLVELLGASEGQVAQSCINFVLSIKDSRELALLGLALLTSGLKEGWSYPAIGKMKLVANKHQQEILYGLAPQLFDLDDFLEMDPAILSKEHREELEKYTAEREGKISFITNTMGEVAGSALREKSKVLPNDAEVKEFRRLVNDLLAHGKVSLKDMADAKLDSTFRLARRLKNLMPVIQTKLKEKEAEK